MSQFDAAVSNIEAQLVSAGLAPSAAHERAVALALDRGFGLAVDAEQKRDKDGQFAASAGYKEIAHTAEGQPWQWAKTIAEYPDKTKHSLNIKHAGEPKQFIATRSFSHPGITGASQPVGRFGSFQEAHEAGERAINSLPSSR